MILTDQQKRDGEAILWALAILLAKSEVSEEDVAAAALLWSRRAPQAARQLIYAGRSQSPYNWDGEALRYTNPNGSQVAQRAVKNQVNSFVDTMAEDLADITRRMNEGRLSIPQWQNQMADTVKRVHVATKTVGLGGVDRVGLDDRARMTVDIDDQLRKLLEFSRGLTDLNSDRVTDEGVPDYRITPKRAVDRAKLYAATARTAYEQSVHDSWIDLVNSGVACEMSNVLDPMADHCEPDEKKGTPGCPEETARKWVPVGDMSIPGQRTCKMNCRCYLRYRRVADRGDPSLNLN